MQLEITCDGCEELVDGLAWYTTPYRPHPKAYAWMEGTRYGVYLTSRQPKGREAAALVHPGCRVWCWKCLKPISGIVSAETEPTPLE